MTNFVSHGRQTNPHPQYLLESRITPFEDIAQINKLFAYESYSSIYGANKSGIEDPSALIRDGWYYANVNGEKINWNFYDGLAYPSVTLQNISGYAIMTVDSILALPSIIVDTFPTGTGDAIASTAHTRRTYTISNPASVSIGTKYLFYFGVNPSANPELPRIALTLSSVLGDNASSEVIRYCTLATSSGAATDSVKIVVKTLAVYATNYKHELELRIRKASELELGTLSTQISSLNTTVNSHTTSISSLNTTVSNQASSISTLNTTVSGHTTSISSLNTTVSGHSTSISNLQTSVSNLTTTVNGHTTSISNINTSITNLQTDVNNLNTDIGNLQDQIDGLSPHYETRTLQVAEASARAVTLNLAPAFPSAVRLFPKGGPEQINGVDFSVSGDTLSWVGLGLEGVLEAGDVIVIQY